MGQYFPCALFLLWLLRMLSRARVTIIIICCFENCSHRNWTNFTRYLTAISVALGVVSWCGWNHTVFFTTQNLKFAAGANFWGWNRWIYCRKNVGRWQIDPCDVPSVNVVPLVIRIGYKLFNFFFSPKCESFWPTVERWPINNPNLIVKPNDLPNKETISAGFSPIVEPVRSICFSCWMSKVTTGPLDKRAPHKSER